MLQNLGRYLREQYNETIQPYSDYDPQKVNSRSTDVDRTIQSADALLRGLYKHLEGTPEEVYPVINTREIERETELLVWDGWPALVLWSEATHDDFFTMVSDAILRNVINASALAAVGEEIGLSEECDPTRPTFFPFQCAIDAEDFYSCAIPQGTTASLPVTGRHYPQLVQALETYNAYAMGKFDELTNGGRFLEAVGAFGYPLATSLLSYLAGGGRSLTHYSGHDISLMPLYNTLGNTTLLNPRFGAAMIFESWTIAGSGGGSGTAFIVAKIGEPDQAADSNFTYTFQNFSLTCISPSGTQYVSASGCPIEDLQRYVATRAPQSAMGICYTSTTTQQALNCTPSDPAPPETYCSYYRGLCLDTCGASGAMKPDLSCVPVSMAVKGEERMAAGDRKKRAKRGRGERRVPNRSRSARY